MQQATRQEIKEIKATVRQTLERHPVTRKNDNARYYHVCKQHAKQIGMEQRQNPDLLDPETRANRAKKERDMVELARRGGLPQ